MASILEEMGRGGHEQVVLVADPAVGLRAVIAIHSTALGPALGGVRFWTYPDESAAIADALRLSRAMTLKAAAAGLDQGGGKAVVMLEPGQAHTEPMLRALGRAIDGLGGRYVAGEDVGATQEDMDWLALETEWVTGVDPALGGSGDPSPTTALGVFHAMRAACAEAFGDPSLAGRRVVVQGVGHVGMGLVALLRADGASVAVADVSAGAVETAVRDHGAEALAVSAVVAAECDVLAPCALGGTISAESVPRLRCRVVCGAANNQLATIEDGDALAARGIVYAPDFVANAGGIINIAEEFVGYRAERAAARARGIEATTARVFALARERGISPARAAEAYAQERIDALVPLAARFRPGDRTAWSRGEPLRRLRPR